MDDQTQADDADHPVADQTRPTSSGGNPNVLPYYAPAPKAAKDRWHITGRATKQVSCEKCNFAFRYELSRKVRSWSVRSPLMILGMMGAMAATLIYLGPMPCLASLVVGFWLCIRVFSRSMIRSAAGGLALVGNGNDAAISANKRLRRRLKRAAEPVACPHCGWYQRDMVAVVRSRSFRRIKWLLPIGLILGPALGLIVWDLQISVPLQKFGFDDQNPWTLPITVAAVILTSLTAPVILRWGFSSLVNPNRTSPNKPEPFPDSPVPISEAEWVRRLAAPTNRITASRQSPSATAKNAPLRVVPTQSR